MAQKVKPSKKRVAKKPTKSKKSTPDRQSPRRQGKRQQPPPHPVRRRAAAADSPPVAREKKSPRPPSLPVGLHAGVPYLVYHRDPAPAPSLSASFIKRVEESSPAHAWLTHPRLNADYQPDKPSREMDFGSAAHALLLGSQELSIINAADWRSDKARAFRDRARETGFAPVLVGDYGRLAAMKAKLFEELPGTELAGVFDHKAGLNECVAVWKEDGFFFRARADRWLPPMAMTRWPDGLILDYKTTWDSASPERWSTTVFNIGSDFQSVLYPHGFALAQIQSGKGHAEGQPVKLPAFRYVVQECEPPYEFQIFGPSNITAEHTTSKIVRAFEQVKGAFQAKKPPGYSRQTVFFDPPAWELKKEERAQLARLATA